MMKINALVYIIAGVVAVVGGLFAAYVNIVVGDAIGSLGTLEATPGTDTAALQESAQALGGVLLAAWIWIIAVLVSGGLAVKTGVDMMRSRK